MEKEIKPKKSKHRIDDIPDSDLKIARLIAEGGTAPEIGQKLGFSPRTIQGRINRMRKKTSAKTIPQLIAILQKAKAI